jgi:hypothetical protein
MFITICAFFPAVKKTAKTVSLHQIQNLKKYEKASTLCVGEINFGSFELLRTKNGSVVEVGSGMGTFFPGLVSSACTILRVRSGSRIQHKTVFQQFYRSNPRISSLLFIRISCLSESVK